ncbi:MAG: PLP-dependent aspartate aminotransferase family protein [candidate division WOR-3 bacterium]
MIKKDDKRKSISTRAVHGGEGRFKYADSLTVPIVQTSTYVFKNSSEIARYTSKRLIRFEYGRYGNPTQHAAEVKLAQLEGAEECLLFDSGMSAVTTSLLALLSKGDHMILTDDAYGMTLKFVTKHLPRFGIEVSVTKMGDYDEMEKAIRKNTKLIFSESPTNPYLNIADLVRLKEIKDKYGVLMLIDSTFATPYNQRPLEWGMDLVIHSATKYFGGHNDILAGAVLGSKALMEGIKDYQHACGSIIDPHCCYLLLRGLKTFALRVDYQNRSAMEVAQWLEAHPKIKKVYYPGLPSHHHHQIAKEQMDGYGGVVTFLINRPLKDVKKFLDNLKMIYIAPSLGGVETLITHPATVTYYRYTRKERYQLGIVDQLVRLAVGVEDTQDIIADLEQALNAMP